MTLAAALAAAALGAAGPADLEAPRFGAWGVDPGAGEAGVRPGDDFYRFAEGRAANAMAIPADRSSYGAFEALRELSARRSRAALEAAASDPKAAGDEARIGALWAAFMDEARLERLDAAPMRAQLQEIRRTRDRGDVAALMGRASLGFGSSLYQLIISPDVEQPGRYALRIGQGGLGLPDRAYYLDPLYAAQKQAYRDYLARLLGMVGWPEPEARADDIVKLETALAEASLPRSERRDRLRSYSAVTRGELTAAAPGFDWDRFLSGAEVGRAGRLVLDERASAPKLAAVFASTPMEVLRAWLAFGLADTAAPYLSSRFATANFAFRHQALEGQPAERPRWRRGVELADQLLGEALGQAYVRRWLDPAAKAQAQAMADRLKAAMAGRLRRLDWVSEPTRFQALAKLARLQVKVGYPDRWRSYQGLEVRRDDLYGDLERAIAFDWRRQAGRLDQPVDRGEWGLTAPTVNAYYDQTRNEVEFPAGLLQPPFFDPQADLAVNYGAIGAVIGHELTHGFDEDGRRTDGDGRLSAWWTAQDEAAFAARAAALGAQYSAIEPLPGAHVDGKLTLGEDAADLGGLLVALDAYHAALKGRPAPLIDGLSGDQRLFLAWAQVWRSKSTEAALRRRLTGDAHAPEPARVNTPLTDIDAWYEAFGIKPGDRLYRPPQQRVRIW